MAAGDIVITAQRKVSDTTSIIADLSGVALVADDIVPVVSGSGQQVRFVVVKG